ncbi:hypothetical protein GGR52DRAFT_423223 [Hypoxylon sp. FL1284]|nr:hypothetical protein GGR52DRAFT_423223 [Hypoxylon sp. FL1284]
MPLFTPTKASAACSRGLTRSHTPITPILPILAALPRLAVASPLRSHRPPLDVDSPPALPYRSTPVRTPVRSPTRSPFLLPDAPTPRTPCTPPFIVSPIVAAAGARERRQDSRLGAGPSTPPPKPLHVLASVGARGARERRREARRVATPGACDRVMMLLPAKWCPHQVSPSRMKDGMRVVRITIPKAQKPTAVAAEKPRPSERISEAKPELITAGPLAVSKKRVATSPPAETRPLKRVVRSPTAGARPEPVSSVTPDARPASHVRFRNPDLNDRIPYWRPRMFEPEMDRYNWTWSDWDSPSREIEDVTYESEDWPVRDPLAGLPPQLRDKVKAILAMRPDATPPALSPSSPAADAVRNKEGGFSSNESAPAKEPTRSSSSDSSWVKIDEDPWPTWLLEMRLDDPRFNPLAERIVIPEFSPLSSRSGSSSDASIHLQQSEKNTRDYSVETAPAPSAPKPGTSSPSAWSEFSSWVDVGAQEDLGGCLDILRQAEERLRERQAQRAQTGIRDRLPGFDSDSSSGGSTPSQSTSAILRHFRSLSGPSSGSSSPTTEEPSAAAAPTVAIPQAFTGPVRQPFSAPPPSTAIAQHFHTLRQLPSALATEPRQPVEEPSRGAGFGWKSLACVAAAAATVGAGLAYAWLSG